MRLNRKIHDVIERYWDRMQREPVHLEFHTCKNSAYWVRIIFPAAPWKKAQNIEIRSDGLVPSGSFPPMRIDEKDLSSSSNGAILMLRAFLQFLLPRVSFSILQLCTNERRFTSSEADVLAPCFRERYRGGCKVLACDYKNQRIGIELAEQYGVGCRIRIPKVRPSTFGKLLLALQPSAVPIAILPSDHWRAEQIIPFVEMLIRDPTQLKFPQLVVVCPEDSPPERCARERKKLSVAIRLREVFSEECGKEIDRFWLKNRIDNQIIYVEYRAKHHRIVIVIK